MKKNQAQELTEREWEIVLMAASGMTAKEIADALNLSVFTARAHIRNIYEKMGTRKMASVVFRVLTTQQALAVKSFCESNNCEILQWVDPEKFKSGSAPERCILQYETAKIEAMHIGGGMYMSSGQIMPKPIWVALFPKGMPIHQKGDQG